MNFQVELTSYCDLSCGYCPNKDMKRPRKFMSDEVWQLILNSYIVPYKDLNLNGGDCPPTFIGHKDGEPLLNKQLPDRLRELSAVAPDIKIDVYSHGLMLPKLADQGRDFIQFLGSLPNRSRYLMSYHPRNHDGSHNDYEPVVRYLSSVLRNPPPNVEFITVSHKSKWVTPYMQQGWREVWAGLPITVHCNASLNPWTGRIEEEGVVEFGGCPYADFGHWFFGVTGNVVPCCLDLEEEVVLGNVMSEDVDEILDRTTRFYEDQRRHRAEGSRPKHRLCDDCFGYKRSEKVDLVQLGVLTK